MAPADTEDEEGGESWHRPFGTIMAGQAVSLVGSSAVQFALVWTVAIQTGSAAAMGMAGLAGFLPAALLAPVAGVVADRYNRKNVCILSDLSVGLVAVAFAALLGIAGTSVAVIVAVLAARSLLGAFQQPAMQAMVPQIVPQQSLMRANSVAQIISSASLLLGPALGAVLFAAIPLWAILATDMLGALVAAGALLAARMRDHRADGMPPAEFRPMRDAMEGLRVFVCDRNLLLILLVETGCMLFFLPLSSFYPLMTSQYFSGTGWDAGVVEVAWSLGMLVASAVLGALHPKDEVRVALLAMVALGAVVLGCGLLPATRAGWWGFVALCLVMGAMGSVYSIPIVTYLQRTVEPAKLGRAFAAFQLVATLTMPVGLAFASPVADAVGVQVWFAIAGAACLACALAGILGRARLAGGSGGARGQQD